MVTEDDTYVMKGPTPEYSIPNFTLGKELFEIYQTAPTGRTALIDVFTGSKVSYSELLQDSCNLAQALRNAGYDNNCLVGICSKNNLQIFTVLSAAQFNASPTVLLNPGYTKQEFKHTLGITKPSLVFVSSTCAEKIVRLKSELTYLERIVLINSTTEPNKCTGVENLHEFISRYNGRSVSPGDFLVKHVEPKTNPALILHSSGTTGLPKGVALSHFNLNASLSESIFKSNSKTVKTDLGLSPFFHIMGLFDAMITLKAHNQLAVFQKFDEDVFLRTIQDYKVDFLFLPPTLAVLLIKSNKVKNYDLSHVQAIGCGSAPLKKETELKLKERFGNIGTAQGYGMTELTGSGTFGVDRPGSVGKLLDFLLCKVRDPDTGKSLGPFKSGELCFKGPTVMLGYHNNEKATRDMFTTDGWLKTGDIGYYDDEGYFYVVDRIKELIKYKGHQVAPAELEALLINHPKINDAAVIGLPDDLCGELPLAFVVKQKNCDITEKEVQDYVAERVSSQKQLRGGVVFTSNIPKTSVGKILRRKLKEVAMTCKLPSSKSKL